MDNITLSKEQLYQLIGYINKRGFHEPLVIAEILDHFACKVEEKMNAHPGIFLDDAMINAHNDFGVLGFQPVAKAFEVNVKKKYKNIYRAELKKVLMNPLYVLIVVLACMFYYKGYIWGEVHNYKHIFDINDVSLLAYCCIIIVMPVTMFFKYRRKGSPVTTAILSRSYWAFLILASMSFQPHDDVLNARQLLFTSVTGTLGVFLAMMAIFTIRNTLKRGYDDTLIVYDYLDSVQQ